VAQHNGYSLFYLTDVDPRGSMGLGGKEEAQVGRAAASSPPSITKPAKWSGSVHIMAMVVAADC
jgi:hypothetical protein